MGFPFEVVQGQGRMLAGSVEFLAQEMPDDIPNEDLRGFAEHVEVLVWEMVHIPSWPCRWKM